MIWHLFFNDVRIDVNEFDKVHNTTITSSQWDSQIDDKSFALKRKQINVVYVHINTQNSHLYFHDDNAFSIIDIMRQLNIKSPV